LKAAGVPRRAGLNELGFSISRPQMSIKENDMAVIYDPNALNDFDVDSATSAPKVWKLVDDQQAKDAEMFQWMCDKWGYSDGIIFFEGFQLGPTATLRDAIDAAMKAEGK
jgi:hypothetical protein